MVISFVNPAFLKQVGYTEEEVIGRNYNFLQGRDTNLEQLALFKQAVKEQKDVQITLKNYCRDGSWFWNRLMLGPILDQDGKCTHFLGIQEDITQQRIHEEYIEYQNTHDQLTGLLNQITFEKVLEQTFEKQKLLTLLYIDLDDFSSMNDSLGYYVGNKVIKNIASRLKDFLKPDEVLSRYAEDEFVLLIKGQHDHKK